MAVVREDLSWLIDELTLYMKRETLGLPTTPKDIRKLQARARYLRQRAASIVYRTPSTSMLQALTDYNHDNMPPWGYLYRPGEKPS